jgi:hypothetical protein
VRSAREEDGTGEAVAVRRTNKEVRWMANAQEVLFAAVGAGDFALEKLRKVGEIDRKTTQKLYRDFVKRGRTLTTKVKSAGATKQAIAQTRIARTQVKAAATSVTKAARADAKAAKTAAEKTVE